MKRIPQGIALPMVLLFLVILTTTAAALFSLAYDGVRRGEWEIRWFLSQRVMPSESHGSDLDWTHLGGGFHLVRSPVGPTPSSPVPQRILWCLIPSIEAIRESFSLPMTSGPVMGPMGLRDLAATVAGVRGMTREDSGSLRLSSDGADDFLIEVRVADDIRLAVGAGRVSLPDGEAWSGLLILKGEISGVARGTVTGGLWHWGDALPPNLHIDDHAEIREHALRALPSCPEPLFHIADLGRR